MYGSPAGQYRPPACRVNSGRRHEQRHGSTAHSARQRSTPEAIRPTLGRMARALILTGERGAGKTMLCLALAALSPRYCGLVSPPLLDRDGNRIGFAARCLATGGEWVLGRSDAELDGPRFGRFSFSSSPSGPHVILAPVAHRVRMRNPPGRARTSSRPFGGESTSGGCQGGTKTMTATLQAVSPARRRSGRRRATPAARAAGSAGPRPSPGGRPSEWLSAGPAVRPARAPRPYRSARRRC